MRILYVGLFNEWLQWFADNGHDVHLVTEKKYPSDKRGIIQHFFPKKGRLEYLKKLIEEIKPDVVHAHCIKKYGWLVSKTGFHPIIVTVQGWDLSAIRRQWYYIPLTWACFKRIDFLHVPDEVSANWAIQNKCPKEKIIVKQWGVDTTFFTPGKQRNSVVLTARTFTRGYGNELFINAANWVARKHPDVEFIMLGDGPLREKMKKYAKDGSVFSKTPLKCSFPGRVSKSEIKDYMATALIYVDTYHSKRPGGGNGLAVTEALSCGTPVIMSNIPGIDCLIEKHSMIYRNKDCSNLAEKINYIIENPKEAKWYGQKCRERAVTHYDNDTIMSDWEEIYRKVIR